MGFVPKPTPQQPSEFRNRAMRMQLSVSVKLTSIAFVGRDSAAAKSPPLKGKAIAYEQAVPQTEAAKRHYAGGSCRGGFQTRPRSAFTVCEVDPSLAVRTSTAADDGNSLAASLWHKGGFQTRPYKVRDRDVLPVRGLRDACHMRLPCLKGEAGWGCTRLIPHPRATRAALPPQGGEGLGSFRHGAGPGRIRPRPSATD